ncbi:hypothetical protein IWQ61_005934 [Dispira simplex]|nr:hypothetical protein IWQ61_005934 [Dispira simplex]
MVNVSITTNFGCSTKLGRTIWQVLPPRRRSRPTASRNCDGRGRCATVVLSFGVDTANHACGSSCSIPPELVPVLAHRNVDGVVADAETCHDKFNKVDNTTSSIPSGAEKVLGWLTSKGPFRLSLGLECLDKKRDDISPDMLARAWCKFQLHSTVQLGLADSHWGDHFHTLQTLELSVTIQTEMSSSEDTPETLVLGLLEYIVSRYLPMTYPQAFSFFYFEKLDIFLQYLPKVVDTLLRFVNRVTSSSREASWCGTEGTIPVTHPAVSD